MKRHKHADTIIAWANGAEIECRSKKTNWYLAKDPNWFLDCEYRIKQNKPSINWDHVSPEFNYLAQDLDGSIYLFSHKPEPKKPLVPVWSVNMGVCIPADSHISLIKGTCDWKDSLVERHK